MNVKALVKHQKKYISESCTRVEVNKLSISQSLVLRLNLVPSGVHQRRKLNLGDAPQLVEVETLAVADITSVMIHWVSNGTSTFEEMSGWEAVLMERLMIRTADLSEAEVELWAIKR